MRIIGIVPARMASSRFPGKPLYPIIGRPMIEHVVARAAKFKDWSGLFLATCDTEIEAFGKSKNISVIMTSDKHVRCLDRVAEAITRCGQQVVQEDIIVCVQGDEPLMSPDMVQATVAPLLEDKAVYATVLAMAIVDEEQFKNPDTVKIIHDLKGDVLYTSRAPVPYCKVFSKDLGARRIYGIFAFRWGFLKRYTQLEPSPLEIKESCDSNRILDHGLRQRIAPYPFRPSYSVDNPHDIALVEAAMKNDPLTGTY